MSQKLEGLDIKGLRKRTKMNQIEFAAYLGVEKGTVNRWETGKRRPSQLALRQLQRLQKRVDHE